MRPTPVLTIGTYYQVTVAGKPREHSGGAARSAKLTGAKFYALVCRSATASRRFIQRKPYKSPRGRFSEKKRPQDHQGPKATSEKNPPHRHRARCQRTLDLYLRCALAPCDDASGHPDLRRDRNLADGIYAG